MGGWGGGGLFYQDWQLKTERKFQASYGLIATLTDTPKGLGELDLSSAFAML